MNATALSDTDLVAQILAGQRDAFAVLVERHLHSALAIARARLLNPADADDAVQEAFLRAYRGLRTLREPAKFGPWLLTIARHEAARLVVKGRSTLGADPAGAPDLAAAAEPEPLRAELHAQLRDHIANLPETAREVLLLHYFAGRTTREIAALLDIRQAAVLKRLQRARESLAETLLRDLETERPSRDALNKKAAHIAALTAGLAIQQTATASAASIAAALLVPKTATIAAGLIGAAVTVGGIAAFVWQTRGHETLASQVQREQRGAAVTNPARQQEVASDPVDVSNAPKSSPSGTPRAPGTPAAQRVQVARAGDPAPQEPDASAAPAGTNNSAQQAPGSSAGAGGKIELSRTVSLKFEKNVHIAEVLNYLQENTGIHFLIDRRAVGVPAASDEELAMTTRPYPHSGRIEKIDLQERSVIDALDRILEPAGLRAVLAPGYLWISTPGQIKSDAMAYPRTQYAKYPGMEAFEKNQPVNLQFNDVHVNEVISFLNEIYNLDNVAVDWRVIAPPNGRPEYPVFEGRKVSDGAIESIRLKNVPLEVALRILGRMTNLTFSVRKDYLWLSSEQMLRHDGITPLPPEERWPEMDKILASPITVEFEDVNLADIFNFIMEIYNVHIAIDQRVVAWKKEPRAAAPIASAVSAHITHGLIRSIVGKDMLLTSVLDIITRDLDLAYAVRGDAVVITSPNTLNSKGPAQADLVSPEEFVAALPASHTLANEPASDSSGRWDAIGHDYIELESKIISLPPRKFSQPHFEALRRLSDGFRAKINTGQTSKWYAEGEGFDDYKVEHIDARYGSVELANESTNEKLTLYLERHGL